MQVSAPGIVVTAIIAAFSELLSYELKRAYGLDAPAVMVAIALGAVLGNLLPARARKALAPGLTLFTKKVLKIAIVLLGLKFTAEKAQKLGGPVLATIVACLALALALGALLGPRFGASRRISLLLGCGTAICGATAVVTIAPLVEAKDDEVAFSIATIFLFNVVALFGFPALGHHWSMGDLQFGTWVGTAVNDTSSVVATAQAYSSGAQEYATAIKLIRTLALVPLAIAVGTFTARARGGEGKKVSLGHVFPWFVLGFAATAALANLVHLPEKWVTAPLLRVANDAIVGVLAAVGLNLDARKVVGSGARSLALGFSLAAIMAVASLAMVRALL
jgi:uncharacterized integral membrane protein (TIGR00698 family)